MNSEQLKVEMEKGVGLFKTDPHSVAPNHITLVVESLCNIASSSSNKLIPADIICVAADWLTAVISKDIPVLRDDLVQNLSAVAFTLYLQEEHDNNDDKLRKALFSFLQVATASPFYRVFIASTLQTPGASKIEDLLPTPLDFAALRQDMVFSVQPCVVLGLLKMILRDKSEDKDSIDPMLFNVLLTMHPDNVVAFLTFPKPSSSTGSNIQGPSPTNPDSHLAMPRFPTAAEVANVEQRFADPELTRQIHIVLHQLLNSDFQQKEFFFDVLSTFIYNALVVCGGADNLLCSFITNDLPDYSTKLLHHFFVLYQNMIDADDLEEMYKYYLGVPGRWSFSAEGQASQYLQISYWEEISTTLIALTASPSTCTIPPIVQFNDLQDDVKGLGGKQANHQSGKLFHNHLLHHTTLLSSVSAHVQLDTMNNNTTNRQSHHGHGGAPVQKLLHNVDGEKDWTTKVHRENMPIWDSINHMQGKPNSLHHDDFEKIVYPWLHNLYKIGLDDFKKTEASQSGYNCWYYSFHSYRTIDPKWYQTDRHKSTVKNAEWDKADYTKTIYDLLLSFAENGPFDEKIWSALYFFPSCDPESHYRVELSEQQRFNILYKNSLLFTIPPQPLEPLWEFSREAFNKMPWPSFTTTPETLSFLTPQHKSKLRENIISTADIKTEDVIAMLDTTRSWGEVQDNLNKICYFLRHGQNISSDPSNLKTAICGLVLHPEKNAEVVEIILLCYYNRVYCQDSPITNLFFADREVRALAEHWPINAPLREVLVAMVTACPDLAPWTIYFFNGVIHNKLIKPTTRYKFINTLANKYENIVGPSRPSSVSLAMHIAEMVTPLDQQLYMDINHPTVFFETNNDHYIAQSAHFGSLDCCVIPFNARVMAFALTSLTGTTNVNLMNFRLHDQYLGAYETFLYRVLPILQSQHEIEVYHAVQLLSVLAMYDGRVRLPRHQLGKNDQYPRLLLDAIRAVGKRLLSGAYDPLHTFICAHLYFTFVEWALEEQVTLPPEEFLSFSPILATTTRVLYSLNPHDPAQKDLVDKNTIVAQLEEPNMSFMHIAQFARFPEMLFHLVLKILMHVFQAAHHTYHYSQTIPNLIKLQLFTQLGLYTEQLSAVSKSRPLGGPIEDYHHFARTHQESICATSFQDEVPFASITDRQKEAMIRDFCGNISVLHHLDAKRYGPFLKLIPPHHHNPLQHISTNVMTIKHMRKPQKMSELLQKSLTEVSTLPVPRSLMAQLCLYEFILKFLTTPHHIATTQCTDWILRFMHIPIHMVSQPQILSQLLDQVLTTNVLCDTKKLLLGLFLINNAAFVDFTQSQASALVSLTRTHCASGLQKEDAMRFPQFQCPFTAILLTLSALALSPYPDIVSNDHIQQLLITLHTTTTPSKPNSEDYMRFLYTCFKWRPRLLALWPWENDVALHQVVAIVMSDAFDNQDLPNEAKHSSLLLHPDKFCVASTLFFLSEHIPTIRDTIAVVSPTIFADPNNNPHLDLFLTLALETLSDANAPPETSAQHSQPQPTDTTSTHPESTDTSPSIHPLRVRPVHLKLSTITHFLTHGFAENTSFNTLESCYPMMYPRLCQQLLSTALVHLSSKSPQTQPLHDDTAAHLGLDIFQHFLSATPHVLPIINTKDVPPQVTFLQHILDQLASHSIDLHTLVCQYLSQESAAFIPHLEFTHLIGDVLLAGLDRIELFESGDHAYDITYLKCSETATITINTLCQQLLSCLNTTTIPITQWLAPVLIKSLALLYGFANELPGMDAFNYQGPPALAELITTLHDVLTFPGVVSALGPEYKYVMSMLHTAAHIAEYTEVLYTNHYDGTSDDPNSSQFMFPHVTLLAQKTGLNMATCQILISQYCPPIDMLNFMLPEEETIESVQSLFEGTDFTPEFPELSLSQIVQCLEISSTILHLSTGYPLSPRVAKFCTIEFMTTYVYDDETSAAPLSPLSLLQIITIVQQFDVIDDYNAFVIVHTLLSRGWSYDLLLVIAESLVVPDEEVLPPGTLFNCVIVPLLRYTAKPNNFALKSIATSLTTSIQSLASTYQDFFAPLFNLEPTSCSPQDFLCHLTTTHNIKMEVTSGGEADKHNTTAEAIQDRVNGDPNIDPNEDVTNVELGADFPLIIAQIVLLYKTKQGSWDKTSKDQLPPHDELDTQKRKEVNLQYLFVLVDLCNHFLSKFTLHNGQLLAIFHTIILACKGQEEKEERKRQREEDDDDDDDININSNPASGSIFNMQTGEGKSVTLAVVAAILTLLGRTVDVVSSTAILAARDAADFQSFFKSLGLSCSSNQDLDVYTGGVKQCYNKQIVYGDLSDFKCDYLRHIAYCHNTRGKRKFDIILMDEADSILVDSVLDTTRISEHAPGMDELLPVYGSLLSYARSHKILHVGDLTTAPQPEGLKEIFIYDSTWSATTTKCSDPCADPQEPWTFHQKNEFLEVFPIRNLTDWVVAHSRPQDLLTKQGNGPHEYECDVTIKYQYSCTQIYSTPKTFAELTNPSRVFVWKKNYYQIGAIFSTFVDSSQDVGQELLIQQIHEEIERQYTTALTTTPAPSKENITITTPAFCATLRIVDVENDNLQGLDVFKILGTPQTYQPIAAPHHLWVLVDLLHNSDCQETFNLCQDHFKNCLPVCPRHHDGDHEDGDHEDSDHEDSDHEGGDDDDDIDNELAERYLKKLSAKQSAEKELPLTTTVHVFSLIRTAHVKFYSSPTLSEAVNALIESAHTPGTTLAKRLLNPFPTISPYTRKLFEDNFLSYLLNAYHSLDLTPDVDYSVNNGLINIISRDTGVTMGSAVQWDFGLHQFLQVKHGIKITTETLSSVFISSLNYIDKYTTLFGCTGTIGDKHVMDYYKTNSLLRIAHHLIIPPIYVSRRVDYPPIITTNQQEQYQHIIFAALAEAHLRRSVLIVMDNIKEAASLDVELKATLKMYPTMAVNCFLYTNSNDEHNRMIIEKKCPAATIIISTNLAGRGTSIATDAFKPFGGLHVIIAGGSSASSRIQKQALGRTARCGEYGSAQIILFDPCSSMTPQHPGQQLNLLHNKAAQQEEHRLQSINNFHTPFQQFQHWSVFFPLTQRLRNLKLTDNINTSQYHTDSSRFKFESAMLLREINAFYCKKKHKAVEHFGWSDIEGMVKDFVQARGPGQRQNSYIPISQKATNLAEVLSSKNNSQKQVNDILNDTEELPAMHYLRGVSHLVKSTNYYAGGQDATNHLYNAYYQLSLAARGFVQESAALRALAGAYVATSDNHTPELSANQLTKHQEGYDHFTKNIGELLTHVKDLARCCTIRIVPLRQQTKVVECTFSHIMPTHSGEHKALIEQIQQSDTAVFLDATNLPFWESSKIDVQTSLIKAASSGAIKVEKKKLSDFATLNALSREGGVDPGKDVSFDFLAPGTAYPLFIAELQQFEQHFKPKTITLAITATNQHINNFLLPYIRSTLDQSEPSLDESTESEPKLKLFVASSFVRDIDTKATATPTLNNKAVAAFAQHGSYAVYSEHKKMSKKHLLFGYENRMDQKTTLHIIFRTIDPLRSFHHTFQHFLPSLEKPQDDNTIFAVSALITEDCKFSNTSLDELTKFLPQLCPIAVTATFAQMGSPTLLLALKQLRATKTEFALVDILVTEEVLAAYFQTWTTKFVSASAASDPSKEFTYQLAARGVPKFFNFAVPYDNTWDLIFLGFMAFFQIVAGALIIAFCPGLTKFGVDLITEGVTDLVTLYTAYKDPSSFSMTDYWTSKAIALAGAVIGFGLAKGFSKLFMAHKAARALGLVQKATKRAATTTARTTTSKVTTDAVTKRVITNTLVNEVTNQGVGAAFTQIYPILTRALFSSKVETSTAFSAQDTFSTLTTQLSSNNALAQEETAQPQQQPDEQSKLANMCYISAYEKIASPSSSYLLKIPFNPAEILTRVALGSFVDVDTSTGTGALVKIIRDGGFAVVVKHLLEVLAQWSGKKVKALRPIFTRISLNLTLLIPSLVSLTAAYNKWFWFAVEETKKKYQQEVQQGPSHLQKQVEAQHQTLLTTPSQHAQILSAFQTQHQQIHTQQSFALIEKALLQTTSVLTTQLTSHVRAKYETQQTAHIAQQHYNAGDELAKYVQKSENKNKPLTKLLEDYRGDYTYERNKAIIGEQMHKSTNPHNEQQKSNAVNLHPMARDLHKAITSDAPIPLSVTTGYLRNQHGIDCEIIPSGVPISVATANMPHKPALVAQLAPGIVGADGVRRGKAHVFILDPKTNQYSQRHEIQNVDTTATNRIPKLLATIRHNYNPETHRFHEHADITKHHVDDIRTNMGKTMAENHEATNNYTASFGTIHPTGSVVEYDTYLQKAGFQYHTKNTGGLETRDYQAHLEQRLTADDGFYKFTKITLTLFKKCHDTDGKLPSVTNATHQNGQGSKANYTAAAHMFAVGLGNLGAHQSSQEYKDFVVQHARTSEINVYVNSCGVEVNIDRAQRKFITHLHALPANTINHLLSDDAALRVEFETHYLSVVEHDIENDQQRIFKTTTHHHSQWHRAAFETATTILAHRRGASTKGESAAQTQAQEAQAQEAQAQEAQAQEAQAQAQAQAQKPFPITRGIINLVKKRLKDE